MDVLEKFGIIIKDPNNMAEEIMVWVKKQKKSDLQLNLYNLIIKVMKDEGKIKMNNKEKFDSTSESLKSKENKTEANTSKSNKNGGRPKGSNNSTTDLKQAFLEGKIKEGDTYKGCAVEVKHIKIEDVDIKKGFKKQYNLVEDITIKKVYIPGKYKYVLFVKEKAVYEAENSTNDAINTTTAVTARLDDPLEGFELSVSAASHIICQKYKNGVPEYRMNDELGVSYNSSLHLLATISEMLKPLYEKIKECLFKSDKNINVDETTYKVINAGFLKNGNIRKDSYIYAVSNAIISFYYASITRSPEWLKIAMAYFAFAGRVITDDFIGYFFLGETNVMVDGKPIKVTGWQICLSHGRRRFYIIYKSLPDSIDKENSTARNALRLIDKIYVLEDECKNFDPDQKKAFRNKEEYQGAIDELKSYLSSINPAKDTKLYEAVNYMLSNWDHFFTYQEDGNLKCHNQDAENTIKKIILIRKNSLHMNNPESAQLNMILLTIVQTAIKNGLNVERYLNYIIHYVGIANTDDLLPWSDKLFSLSEDFII